MGIKTSKTGDHRLLTGFLRDHYAKRLEKYLPVQGNNDAEAIREEYEKRFTQYMNESDFGVNDGKFTSYLNIYSGLAAYEILRERGLSQQEGIAAYDFMCLSVRKIAAAMHRTVDLFPNGYELVVKSLLDDMEGDKAVCWEFETVENSDERFEYKINKCLYYDTCKAHGYPEFTVVFCNHDHYAYDVLQRHVRFERIGAIGEGYHCCHDIFYHVKKK